MGCDNPSILPMFGECCEGGTPLRTRNLLCNFTIYGYAGNTTAAIVDWHRRFLKVSVINENDHGFKHNTFIEWTSFGENVRNETIDEPGDGTFEGDRLSVTTTLTQELFEVITVYQFVTTRQATIYEIPITPKDEVVARLAIFAQYFETMAETTLNSARQVGLDLQGNIVEAGTVFIPAATPSSNGGVGSRVTFGGTGGGINQFPPVAIGGQAFMLQQLVNASICNVRTHRFGSQAETLISCDTTPISGDTWVTIDFPYPTDGIDDQHQTLSTLHQERAYYLTNATRPPCCDE